MEAVKSILLKKAMPFKRKISEVSKPVRAFFTDKSGLTAFETAVIAAVVIGAIVVAWNTYLKDNYYGVNERIGNWMNSGEGSVR